MSTISTLIVTNPTFRSAMLKFADNKRDGLNDVSIQ